MPSPRRDSRLADNSSFDNSDCQELSALVMALFDGETDELQTRRARNHLLICQTCANRWLDWNRARSLLLEVPAPAPPETLVWRVLMACRGAAAHRNAALKTGQAPLNSNHVLTAPDAATEIVPSALSDQILARTSRAAKGSEAKGAKAKAIPSFSRRAKALAWPMAVPAAALWLLILQREPLLSTRFDAGDDLAAPTASRQLRRSLLNEASSTAAAPPLSAPHRRINSRLTPNSTDSDTTDSANSRGATPRQTRFVNTSARFSSSPATDSAETDLSARSADTSEANAAVLQRQWQEIEALTSNASRSVEWQTVAFNPGPTLQRPLQQERADRSNAQSSPSRAQERARIAAARLQRANLSNSGRRAARLSPEQPSLRLRAAQWKAAMPRGASLLDTALPQTVPSRVSLPAASAPSSARLIAENFDTEAGRVDEMRSVVDDFRATVAPEETQDPDDEDDDWG